MSIKITMYVIFSDLEKITSTVVAPAGLMSLDNSTLLALDPVLDKTPLYSQLLHSYKWSNKVSAQSSKLI